MKRTFCNCKPTIIGAILNHKNTFPFQFELFAFGYR